jgi:UDP-N-acetylmuramate dehydrogenase
MVTFKEQVSLSQFSNYKIGGPARYFFEAKTEHEVRDALALAKKLKLKVFVLGGGTNLLIDDKGFDGLVLKPAITFLKSKGATIEVGAGVLMKDLLLYATKKKLSGLEWAGGLPGTVGGAVRGNAGAFQGDMQQTVATVTAIDIESGKKIVHTKKECRFGYRSSIFKVKQKKEIVVSATLALEKGDAKTIKSAIEEKIRYRKERHPIEYPNIGSIFKNVNLKTVPVKARTCLKKVIKTDPFPVVPTAYLISEAALRGVSFGGAMISPKHPNFIVNVLDASASDVHTLVALVKKEVYKKFRIHLEEEVEIVLHTKAISKLKNKKVA